MSYIKPHASARFLLFLSGASINTRTPPLPCRPPAPSWQWLRSGTELAPLGEKRQYSFDYQGATHLDVSARTLQPGDSFITTCTFSSTSRNTTTVFGEQTTVRGGRGRGRGRGRRWGVCRKG